jgi:DNA polymerase III subunit delta
MIYVIASNSYHVILEEITKIFPDLKQAEVIDYNKTNIKEIIEEANYTSLFNDEKKIIVKNADFLSSKITIKLDELEQYLVNPNPLSTIVFTCSEKPDERKKVIKIIKEKYSYNFIKPLSYRDIIDRVLKFFKEKKYKISYDNASYISNKCLNNYDIVMMELEKVLLFYNKPCEIEKSDLENIISQYMDDNNFKFVDAVVANDYNLSLKLLNDFKVQKIEPLALISLLAREYRLMLIAKDLYKKGNSNLTIGKELSLQDWQVEKILKNGYNYSIVELEDKLIELTELDFKIKTGKISDFLGIELFILKEQ